MLLAAREARGTAEAHGKSGPEKEFSELSAVLGQFNRRALAIIHPYSEAVEASMGSMAGLRSTAKVLNEAITHLKDAPLDNDVKHDAERGLKVLLGFCQKFSQFQTHAAQALKNVAREKVQGIKQNFIENLTGSDSIIKRGIGRALDARFGERAAERKRAQLEAAADLRETTLPDEDETTPYRGRKNTPGRGLFGGRGAAGGAGVAGASAKTLNAILQTDKGILKQVTRLANGEATELTDEEREDRAKERADEFKIGGAGPIFGAKGKSKVGKAGEGGPGGGVKSFLENVTEGGIGGLVSRYAGPAILAAKGMLSTLGSFAQAAAAPVAVLVAQAASFVHLTNKLGDLQNEYPALKRGGKGIKDDVAAAAHLKENVGKVLGAKTTLAPEGGFLRTLGDSNGTTKAQDELAESRRMGLNPNAYKQAPGTLYQKRMQAQKVTRQPAATEPASQVSRQMADSKQMTMSEEGLKALIRREGGLVKKAYWDVNGWAIGPGMHTFRGQAVHEGQTESEADLLAEARAQIDGKYGNIIRRNLTTPVTQDQFDSMVSVAWNSERAGANLAKRVSQGLPVAPEYFRASAKVQGAGGLVEDAGLVSRRAGEYAQFMSGTTATSMPSQTPIVTNVITNNTNTTVQGPRIDPRNPNASLQTVQGVNSPV